MPTDVRSTLRKVLADLQSEKSRIDGQITAVQGALTALDGRRPTPTAVPAPRRRRRRMSAEARRAIAKRMKVHWAKRRAAAAAGKQKASK